VENPFELSSTLNHIVAFCYNSGRVIKCLPRQAAMDFRECE
jgi:hypothetical protein